MVKGYFIYVTCEKSIEYQSGISDLSGSTAFGCCYRKSCGPNQATLLIV